VAAVVVLEAAKSQTMNQPHITALTFAVFALGLGCEDKAPAAEQPPQPLVAAAAEPSPKSDKPARPLDPSYVPTEALEQLEGLVLESTAPCSETIETLKPALESIARFRQKLVAATTEAEVVQLLTALSTELTQRLPSIAARSETDELRRISAELTASLGDLAESLKLASDAITAQDRQASASMTRRLQNGVANTRSSIERLIEQCAV
jgi:hypothetical protein